MLRLILSRDFLSSPIFRNIFKRKKFVMGEEFLIILPNATLESSKKRAEELRNGVKDLHINHEERDFRITISAGVAVLPKHGNSISEVVRQSDRALYQVKALGRDQVVIAQHYA